MNNSKLHIQALRSSSLRKGVVSILVSKLLWQPTAIIFIRIVNRNYFDHCDHFFPAREYFLSVECVFTNRRCSCLFAKHKGTVTFNQEKHGNLPINSPDLENQQRALKNCRKSWNICFFLI